MSSSFNMVYIQVQKTLETKSHFPGLPLVLIWLCRVWRVKYFMLSWETTPFSCFIQFKMAEIKWTKHLCVTSKVQIFFRILVEDRWLHYEHPFSLQRPSSLSSGKMQTQTEIFTPAVASVRHAGVVKALAQCWCVLWCEASLLWTSRAIGQLLATTVWHISVFSGCLIEWGKITVAVWRSIYLYNF